MSRSTEFGAPGSSQHAGLELAREMRRRWRTGERPPAEEFLSRHPDLASHPESAVELIYEEFCLRHQAGEQDVERDLVTRFPRWAGALRLMVDCHHRLLADRGESPSFPEPGDQVGGCRVVTELSRGTRARVYLAEQVALADRPVVLKVTALDGAEHVCLARLQHTNIVPLYSVLDDAARHVRVLCMPYLGRATLASVLASLHEVPWAHRTGRHVADAVRAADADADTAPALPGPVSAADVFGPLSYTQAVCWIGACLADALHFAHRRGVLHLDLKPANVLIASDGQPLLLDFHLARRPLAAGGPAPEGLGGTPAYMSPEHRGAMQSVRAGGAVPEAVGARADVYSLGAVLYEALSGRPPAGPDAPPLAGPHVTTGLSDIVAKCLRAQPAERYADAAGLAEDLRRHLEDRPLLGVPNRDARERWAKWRRHRPGALRVAVATALVILACAAVATSAVSDARERWRQSGLVADARRFDLARQLHAAADDARVLYGAPSIAPRRLAAVGRQCGALWERRDAIRDLARIPGANRQQLETDLRDIAIFAASCTPDAEAVRILDDAERMLGPSTALDAERRARLATARTRSRAEDSR